MDKDKVIERLAVLLDKSNIALLYKTSNSASEVYCGIYELLNELKNE